MADSAFVNYVFDNVTTTPITPAELRCNYYRKENITVIIIGGYEGIPQNLIINVCVWIGLILLFSILRKRAWNYGRMGLLQRREQRVEPAGRSGYNVWTQLFYGGDEQSLSVDQMPSYDSGAHFDHGMFSWISAVFRITDDQIRTRCGSDAIQYLHFQRYVILITACITVISLAVALPLNFQGTLEGDEKSFGHTTLSNLDPKSWFLWVHVTLGILFVPMATYMLRRFSVKLKLPEVETPVSRTLMISRIPRSQCKKDKLLEHFGEAYPDYEVVELQLAYDVSHLMELDRNRLYATQSRIYSENEAKAGNRLVVRPYKCGNICACCDFCGGSVIDAVEYYTEEERNLNAAIEVEKVKALQHPVGIAFVTFATQAQAEAVLKDHRSAWKCGHNPGSSRLNPILKPHRWDVTFAPRPDEINWENLSVTTKFWLIRSFFINFGLFIVLFFLTTPAVVVNSLDILQFTSRLTKMSPVLSQFLPTVLLLSVSVLMPVLVSYSDVWLSHWTKSAFNYSVMRKTFIFLLFMVVILPSLGLTTAQAFFEWAVTNETYRWECIFLPDNGAFFVNYVITSSFIGTGLELMRFSELFMYAIAICCAKSSAETPGIRRYLLSDFDFGVRYAWMLLIFSVTTMYSVSCPLITPFGLVYMLLKHFVDRYNIYFAYAPSHINKKIHATAIYFVITALLILQLTLFFFSLLRNGLQGVTIYALVGFCLTLFVVVAQAFFRWFMRFAPISYRKVRSEQAGPRRMASTQSSSEIINGETSADSSFLPSVLIPRTGSSGPVHRLKVMDSKTNQAASNSNKDSGTEASSEDRGFSIYQSSEESDSPAVTQTA